MSNTRDPLAVFDDDVIERVADQSELTADELRDLLVAHQEQARDNPGVDDLVYEWRTQFHEAPVIHRTNDAYYLRLRDHVWDEFADALDVPEVDFHAVLEVHEQQCRADTGASLEEGERMMILTRE